MSQHLRGRWGKKRILGKETEKVLPLSYYLSLRNGFQDNAGIRAP